MKLKSAIVVLAALMVSACGQNFSGGVLPTDSGTSSLYDGDRNSSTDSQSFSTGGRSGSVGSKGSASQEAYDTAVRRALDIQQRVKSNEMTNHMAVPSSPQSNFSQSVSPTSQSVSPTSQSVSPTSQSVSPTYDSDLARRREMYMRGMQDPTK